MADPVTVRYVVTVAILLMAGFFAGCAWASSRYARKYLELERRVEALGRDDD